MVQKTTPEKKSTAPVRKAASTVVSAPAKRTGLLTQAQAKKSDSSMIGKEIGKYTIKKELGKGGMGSVYLASHPKLKGDFVLKKLILKRGSVGARERFKREAQSMMELSNSYVVRMYDYFSEDRADYIVLEYVNGMALDKLLEKEHSLPVPLAMLIFLDICYGLNSAHNRGIIHRDIKPANILISRRGEVKLADFGIAGSEKDSDEAASLPPGTDETVSSSFETLSGTSLGTPAYMSPEQLDDASCVDRRTDIYSMGVMLYQMLTGNRPFKGDLSKENQDNIRKGNYIPPRRLEKSIPLPIAHLIKKMMQANRDKRYKSMEPIIKKVKTYLDKRYDKSTKHDIREYLARCVANIKVEKPNWVPKYRNLKRFAAVVAIVGILAGAWFSGLFHRTVLRPFFVPLRISMEMPSNTGTFSTDVGAKAFFFENKEGVPALTGMNSERVFFQNKKAETDGKNIVFSTRNVYLTPGDYRIKIVQGSYVWWKSITVENGDDIVLNLDFLKNEKRTLTIKGFAQDYDTGEDLTDKTVFQVYVNGAWTPIAKVKPNVLVTGKIFQVRAVCDGYENEQFGLSIAWFQDSLFVNATLKKNERADQK